MSGFQTSPKKAIYLEPKDRVVHGGKVWLVDHVRNAVGSQDIIVKLAQPGSYNRPVKEITLDRDADLDVVTGFEKAELTLPRPTFEGETKLRKVVREMVQEPRGPRKVRRP